jgi:DNA-binding MarR family transcriptional regulator
VRRDNDAWAAPKRSARTIAQFEATVALGRAAEQFRREFVEILKQDDLSDAQFNVLRILRGAGEAGLACGQVAERLIRYDPDVTRLLDRLEKRGLVARTRDAADRRVVRTCLTTAGLELLARLDRPIDDLHERQLGHLTIRELTSLRAIVDAARRRS